MTLSRLVPLLVFSACALGLSAPGQVPLLVDEFEAPRQLSGDEIGIDFYELRNFNVLGRLSKTTTPEIQVEMQHRMENEKLRWELRLLYAAILAHHGNAKGQAFLVHQWETAVGERVPTVARAIYLSWLGPGSLADREDKESNMAWAEDTMLTALSDKRSCRFKQLDKDDPEDESLAPVRNLAIHYGQFDSILTERKCKKVVPVLCRLITEELSRAPADALFPQGLGFGEELAGILDGLKEWDDPAVEAVMLAVVRSAVAKVQNISLSGAMEWLVERKNQSVIHIALDGLWLDDIFQALVETKHPAYLKAVRDKLKDLQDGDLAGPELFKQQCARAHAELILIMGDAADPVPGLMQFVGDSSHQKRNCAVDLLKARKDVRCVPWAAKQAVLEQNWFVLFCLIDLLGEVPGSEATVALVGLLDASFDQIKPDRYTHYTATDYHKRIVEELEKRAGKKLGTTSAAWRTWLEGTRVPDSPDQPSK